MAREKTLHVRLSQEEMDKVKLYARADGRTVSEFVRHYVVNYLSPDILRKLRQLEAVDV